MASIVDKILKVFSENGLFDEGVELIGSWCFYYYQLYLGVKKYPLRTPDIDFCLPYPYKGEKKVGFIKKLEEIGFKVDYNKDESMYLYHPEIKVEFLTVEKGRGSEKAIEIKGLGIKATPLRYMTLLLDDPIIINDRGTKIAVPKPVNFCFHKLLVAAKRKKPDKRSKDIEQAVLTSIIVPANELRNKFKSLPLKWQTTIIKELIVAQEQMVLIESEIKSLLSTLQTKE